MREELYRIGGVRRDGECKGTKRVLEDKDTGVKMGLKG